MKQVSWDPALYVPWDRALYDQIARELAHAAPNIHHALTPIQLSPPPNPFETPRIPTDPPPLWLTMPAAPRAVPKRRRSRMPFVVLALAAAIGVGLWVDPSARSEWRQALGAAASRATAAIGGLR